MALKLGALRAIAATRRFADAWARQIPIRTNRAPPDEKVQACRAIVAQTRVCCSSALRPAKITFPAK
jgi:hypothetical protein